MKATSLCLQIFFSLFCNLMLATVLERNFEGYRQINGYRTTTNHRNKNGVYKSLDVLNCISVLSGYWLLTLGFTEMQIQHNMMDVTVLLRIEFENGFFWDYISMNNIADMCHCQLFHLCSETSSHYLDCHDLLEQNNENRHKSCEMWNCFYVPWYSISQKDDI